ncbi:D-2-hydroxyglutarate--pyruvate transhydrogenase DLD2 [Nymphon striatum]|nr:D-2-hydroxyglutarate--pyruvate transhydrogenase DLD2 [Nymphon striatum]
MDNALINQFIALVGEKYALTSADDLSHYTHENRGLYIGDTPLVLKPANTEEVSEILKLAALTKTVIVPQGGHTGHVGGAVSDESGTQVVLSLERMNEIREATVILCEAGVILETVQKLADDNDRLFPLALGSQGSCQIGGNISTNAGGTGVLAYGNTRALVMGLEVVLPSGEIWNGLRRLKKDNTGYDLKDLFIGAEGTLGIVTAAVLKLFPKPRGKAVAFCGVQSPDHALQLFTKASSYAGQGLTAFELMARIPLEQEMPDARLCTFGHLGDGNMHYNISQPTNANTQEFLAKQPEINELIHALVINMNGSVAAEHGVGRLKRDLIAQTKDRVELNLMKSIKKTLDPG